MNTYTISIPWLHAHETIFFDPYEDLTPGVIINTTECWDDGSELYDYEVEVISLERATTAYTLKLRYLEVRNPKIAKVNDAWGVSTIHFDTNKLTAIARWENDPSRKDYNGEVTAKISSQSLTEDLGYITTQRRKRRQEPFRRELLRLDRICALSGESAVSSLEAAHVLDVNQRGGFASSNGMLLRADLHRLFDDGSLLIANDGSVSLPGKFPEDSSYHEELVSLKLRKSVLRRISKALKERNAKSV